MLLLRGIENGKDKLIDPSNIGGANVVLNNVECETSVYVGAAVVMQASGIAKNALADSLANSNVVGVVMSKSDATHCNIRVLGVSAAIFAGLDVTKEYFLSDTVAGQLTTTIPSTSGHVVLKLGQPFSATEFLVVKGVAMVRT